jgi:hypothetical protein
MKIVKLDMEHVNKGTDVFNLPTFFKGTKKQCLGAMLQFQFVKDSSLFGGYWRDQDDNCYYLLP